MKFDFPWGTKLYCRTCRELKSHGVSGTAGVRCLFCERLILAVELVTMYSFDDDYATDPVLSLPLEQLTPAERERRLTDPRVEEGVKG